MVFSPSPLQRTATSSPNVGTYRDRCCIMSNVPSALEGSSTLRFTMLIIPCMVLVNRCRTCAGTCLSRLFKLDQFLTRIRWTRITMRLRSLFVSESEISRGSAALVTRVSVRCRGSVQNRETQSQKPLSLQGPWCFLCGEI